MRADLHLFRVNDWPQKHRPVIGCARSSLSQRVLAPVNPSCDGWAPGPWVRSLGNGRIGYCWLKIWQIFSHGPPGRKESSAQTISGRVAMIIHPFRRRLWANSFIEMNQMSGANTSTLTTLPTFWDVEEDTEDILTHTLIIGILLSYEL